MTARTGAYLVAHVSQLKDIAIRTGIRPGDGLYFDRMKKFYEQGGVSISEASMKAEFDTRPTFDLAQQIKPRLDRSGYAPVVILAGRFVDRFGALQDLLSIHDRHGAALSFSGTLERSRPF